MSDHAYVSRDEFFRWIRYFDERIEKMASQADVDALTQVVEQQTTALAQVSADVASATATIQTELNNLEAQITSGGSLDLTNLRSAVSALQTAVSPLDASVQAIGALVPQPPKPPAEATQPVYTFSGDPSTIDSATWLTSGFETTGTPPQLLYYYSGDAANSGQNGPANGNGLDGGAWVVYTGSLQTVPAA